MTDSSVRPFGVDKWVVSWTQMFAMHICVVAPPGKCFRLKVLFAGNTVWSISERVRGVREDALYRSTLPLLLPKILWEKLAWNRAQSIRWDKLATEKSCCKSVWHTCECLVRVNLWDLLVRVFNTSVMVIRLCAQCWYPYIGHISYHYTVSQKVPSFKFSVTSSNLIQFSKFSHCWKVCEICYKTHTTLPTSP